MHRITFQSNACYRGVTLDGEDRSGRIEGEGKEDHWATHDRALARARESTGTAWLDGPGGGMESSLVCLHSGVFIRPQFCHSFNTDRKQALRVVRALVARRAGIEGDSMMFPCGLRRFGRPTWRRRHSRPGAAPHAVMEAAYARSDLFERRRILMDDWASYLAGESRGPEAATGSVLAR